MASASEPGADSAPNDDWLSLYPFPSHFTEIGGQRMHYLDEGAGPPLLLVHGNPTWSFHWRALILALRSRNRMVAPDHIGCGLSDKPQDYPYRLERHIQNLCELVERLDLRNITLVAQDWGGAIGLGAVLRLRERFNRLVLFNTGAFRSNRMPLRIRVCRVPVLGPLAVRGCNAFARAALRMAVANPKRLSSAIRAGILAPYDAWDHRIAIQRFVEDIPTSPNHPSYQTLLDIEQGLPSLATLPTLLVWGMQDWCFTPHFLERFIDFFPVAEVHRLAAAGHWVMEDAPEQAIAIVREFLERNSPPTGNC